MAGGVARGWRNNLLLALAALAAGGSLWYLDAREEERTLADRNSRAVSAIRADGAVSLEFREGQGTPLTLTKSDGEWRITAPASLRTDKSAVKNLLGVLDKSYDQKAADVIEDPAPYGLHAPVSHLTVKDPGGKVVQLTAGATAPASKKRYLGLGESGPVVLIGESDAAGLLQKGDALRDKRLATVEGHDMTGLVIRQQGGGEIRVRRDTDEKWFLEKPLADLAHAQRVRAWVYALTGARGTAFVPKRPDGAGEWTLELIPAKGNPETLTVWRSARDLLVARPGEADYMVLPQYLTEEFEKDPMDLVALRPLDAAEANELRVETNGTSLSAEKKEKKWPRAEWGDLEALLIQDALRGAPRAAPGEPWLRITVGTGEKALVFTLRKEGKTAFLEPPGRPVALELTPMQLESAQKAVEALFASDKSPASGS
ncbi:MAG: DUF4340 domain-containing protein [Magnetococcales bacterium]|nr:DUF4340 domain-containing protein [Magnetococcales bacterium]